MTSFDVAFKRQMNQILCSVNYVPFYFLHCFRHFWFFSCGQNVALINQLNWYGFLWTMWADYIYELNLFKPVFKLIKRQSCHHIESSQLICTTNQLTGFYVMATSAFKKLNLNQIGERYYHEHSWHYCTRISQETCCNCLYLKKRG